MKSLILLLLASIIAFSQDDNTDGIIDGFNLSIYDIDGDGYIDYLKPNSDIRSQIPFISNEFSVPTLNFVSLWTSPPGAFSNCWDGAVGYFDNDTLLDVAGYTFSPAKFYVWEQMPNNPDSFALVQEIVKAEGGGFGPIVTGDTDGDGKKEIILADFATFTRIYVYENDGNNNYVSQNTQTVMMHTNDGETAQGLQIGDMNKNGRKEIICLRGNTGGGMVRLWEHTGAIGSNTYTNLYTYTTVSYIFGKGGYGDSDNDTWDEVLLTFGGLPVFNTFIRRLEYDSTSGSFQHYIFEAPSIGFPTSYKVYDLNNDGSKELISTNNSNNQAASYIYRSSGQNQYLKIDSIFESSDNNSMMISDIKVLSGSTFPAIIYGSFNSRIYIYQYNGTSFTREYENTNYPGAAIRRVYWLPWTGYDGYFNTWSSSSSNGTFYIFKRDTEVGIEPQGKVPSAYKLYQNYPNPFNPNSIIKYQISNSCDVNLAVYDVRGTLVKILVNGFQKAGIYDTKIDGTNLPSGVYFYKLKAGNYSEVRKMILLK